MKPSKEPSSSLLGRQLSAGTAQHALTVSVMRGLASIAVSACALVTLIGCQSNDSSGMALAVSDLPTTYGVDADIQPKLFGDHCLAENTLQRYEGADVRRVSFKGQKAGDRVSQVLVNHKDAKELYDRLVAELSKCEKASNVSTGSGVTLAETDWWSAAEGPQVGDKSSWWDFHMEMVSSTDYQFPQLPPSPTVLILKGTEVTEISAPDRNLLTELVDAALK